MILIKRLTAVIIIMSILFSFSPALAQTADTETSTAYEKLLSLGIYDELKLNGENVTREEFLTAVMGLLKISDGVSVNLPYSDIKEGTKLHRLASAAYQLKFISPAALFYPSDAIKVEEAVKLLLYAIGYDAEAELKGGFPSGYMVKAKRLGIIDSIELGSHLTRSEAAEMLLNTCNCEVNSIVGYSGSYFSYEAIEDKTLLSIYYDIYKEEGVLEADRYSDLKAQDSGLDKNGVMIDGVIYTVDENPVLLGYNVEIYYTDDGDEKHIIYISPYKNKVLTIASEDIVSAAGKELKYDKDGRLKTAVMDSNVSLILNGKLSVYSEAALKPEYGYATLIDYNDDNRYEVASVTSYKLMQIAGISGSSLYSKAGTELELDAEYGDYDVEILKNGVEILKNDVEISKNRKDALSDKLSVDDTVLYACSEGSGRNIKRIYVSSKTVEGKITRKNSDSVVINKKTYKTLKSVHSELTLGKYGIYYIDAFGRLVLADNKTSEVYGYLKKIGTESMDKVVARIYSENEHWVTLELKDKLVFNGSGGTQSTTVKSYFDENGGSQLITYRVNSDAYIIEINTAKYYSRNSDQELAARSTNKFRKYSSDFLTMKYRYDSRSFDGEIGIKSDTVIFSVPDDVDTYGYLKCEDARLEVISTADMVADYTYDFIAYNVDKVGLASCVVVKSGATEALNVGGTIDKLFVVTDVAAAMDSAGAVRTALIGCREGQELTFTVEDDSILEADSIGVGDIIQFSLNSSGNISVINTVYKKGNVYKAPSAVWTSSAMVNGRVAAVDAAEKKILLEYDALGSRILYSLPDIAYIYHTEDNEAEKVDLYNILEDDIVAVSVRNQCIKEIYIIR